MNCKKYFIFFLFLFASFANFADDFGFPPLFDWDEDLSLRLRNDEFRALGPLFEYSRSEEPKRKLLALRPLFSEEDIGGLYSFDILWPFFVYRENNFEKYWRLFFFYSGKNKGETAGQEGEKPHTGLIPFLLYGIDEGGEFYWALFPFYGEARNFISYDSIYFIVFPIYFKTKKGQISGEAYFWPIWNYDESPSFKKFRFFPFYAYHERYGSFRRASYIWPFYHYAEYYNPKASGKGWLLFPFYGQNSFKDLKSWSVLWPFFSVYRREKDEESEDGFGWNMPWPFIQYRRNVDRDEKNEKWRFYLWPLIGRSERRDSDYQFVLWPFISTLYTKGDQGNVEWVWILPFYWSKHAKDKDMREIELYRNFYPFVSYLEKGDFCEIRILDLWFQRNMPAVERNWVPLWVFFNYQSSADAFRYDFLWGLIKYFGNSREVEGFAFQPFYMSCTLVEEKKTETKEVEGTKTEDAATQKKIQRDYLLGLIRTISYEDGRCSARIFWLIDFEF